MKKKLFPTFPLSHALTFSRSHFPTLSLSCFLFFLTSCDNEYRLDSRDRTIIDTTSNKEIARLSKNYEDSSKSIFDRNVARLTDSIVEFQIKAIEKQLNVKSVK